MPIATWCRRSLMIVAVSAVTIAGSTVDAPHSAAARCQVTVGISPGSRVFDYSDTALAQSFSQIAALGAGWVRLDIPWNVVEPTQGSLNWARVDRLVDAARAHGLTVLGLITSTPPWARPAGAPDSDKTAPADPDAFGAFAGAAAAHFGSAIPAYEIWNEPNLAQFFRPRVDVAAYVRMLRAARTAISQAAPQAVVLSGGVTGTENVDGNVQPTDFVRALYAAGAAGAMDAVAVHPYTYPIDTMDLTPNPYNYFNNIPSVHDVMAANGDGGKRIWITEFGAPTGTSDGAVSPDKQSADIIAGITRALQFGYIGNFFIYSDRDTGTDPSDPEQNFGLRYVDNTPKPAYTAIAGALNGC